MLNEKELREQICLVGKMMYDRQMVAANDGNISARLADNRYLCTPTGVSKGLMTPDMLCITDIDGNVIDKGNSKGVSSEVKMHLRVYQKREDVGAVVHAHPIYATTYAVAGKALEKPILAEAIEQFGSVPIAKYAALSTNEVPDSIEPFLEDYNAVLLEFHGAVTWASNLMTAYMKMESLEFYARMLYQTELIGCDRQLDDSQVEQLFAIKKRLGIE